MDGIIILNKPYGITSHQAVKQIRTYFPGQKVGHSGTLDPIATGILPILLGRATRIAEYIIELNKIYLAEIVLGISTDTEDAQGKIIKNLTVPILDRNFLEKTMRQFIGRIEQLPPIYSAVKHQGKPLYYWARKGETVPRRTRQTTIYSIKLIDYHNDLSAKLLLEVECARGTYIRTLAADIGKKIGCGAHLSGLTRTAVGPFRLENSLSLNEIEDKIRQNLYTEVVLTMDTALYGFSKIVLDNQRIKDLQNGKIISDVKELFGETITDEGDFSCVTVRVYDREDRFKALASVYHHEDQLKMKTLKYLS